MQKKQLALAVDIYIKVLVVKSLNSALLVSETPSARVINLPFEVPQIVYYIVMTLLTTPKAPLNRRTAQVAAYFC